MKTLPSGTKLTVTLTLDCELCTDLDGVTTRQIRDLFFADDAYGLKSIVAGKVNPDCDNTHDTEVLIDGVKIKVKATK